MGRPRKPTNVLKMQGAYRKDPQRLKARENEPVNLDPIGPCPEYLTEAGKTAWNDIVTTGPWLRLPDRLAVERTAIVLGQVRSIDRIDANLERILQTWIRLLGLPATERSKVYAPQSKPANKYEKLA